MNKRKDALAGVSKLHLEIREIANRHQGVCTVGKVTTLPGIVTSVVAQADMTLDQRHLDPHHLAAMYREAVEYSQKIAHEENITVEWTKLWDIHPIPLYSPHPLPSGAHRNVRPGHHGNRRSQSPPAQRPPA